MTVLILRPNEPPLPLAGEGGRRPGEGPLLVRARVGGSCGQQPGENPLDLQIRYAHLFANNMLKKMKK